MHPALALAPCRARVLVLGGGDGLAVREILQHPDVDEVVLVDLDPEMTRLAVATNPLLRELNAALARSPQVRVVNEDAMVWLGSQDAATASSTWSSSTSPIPTTSRSASSTRRASTRSCARASTPRERRVVAEHLAAHARRVLLVHRPHARGAGLYVRPYHALVPSFGEWGFALAALRPFDVPPAALRSRALRFLDAPAAGAVRLPARHGARAGRGEPAQQPGPGPLLRREWSRFD